MGLSGQEYWSGLPCLPSGDLPDPEIEPMSFVSSALSGEFFITSATWEVLGDPTGGGKGFGQKAGQQRDCPQLHRARELCVCGPKSIVFTSPKGLGSGDF